MDMVGMVTAGVVGAFLFSLLLQLLSLLFVVASSENFLDAAWSSEEELFTVTAVGVVVVGSFVVVIIRDGITSALAVTGAGDAVVQELPSMSVLIEFGASVDSGSCESLVFGAW